MQGLNHLLNLPAGIKQQIVTDFGNISNLYKKVFDLNQEELKLTGSKSPRLQDIKNELFDIEDKLESYGVTDSREITTKIASDFGEIVVGNKIVNLNKFLQPLGTDFATMQKWLKDNYGI